MRGLLTLGLVVCVAGAAAAQTEIIIRRPGQKDEVIHLDTLRSREALARTQAELGNIARTMRDRIESLQGNPIRLHGSDEPIRTATLALKDAGLASRDMLEPLANGLATLRQQPHIGVSIDYGPRDTDKYGAYVQAVTPGSPAEKAGIMSGDIITRIAGKSIGRDPKSTRQDESLPGVRLSQVISQLAPGKPVDIELRRGTQIRTVKVTPIEDETALTLYNRLPVGRPSSTIALSQMGDLPRIWSTPMATEAPTLGFFNGGGDGFGGGSFSYSFGFNGLFANLELAPLNPTLGAYFGTSEGVLVVNTMSTRSIIISGRRSDSTNAGNRSTTSVMVEGDSIIAAPNGGPVKVINRNALGLEPGDVIMAVDGRKVTSPSQLMRVVGSYDRGDEFKLQIMRQKHAETLPVRMP